MKLIRKGRRKPIPFCNIPSHPDFRGDGLLAPRPNPKLQDRPLSAVRDYLFNTLACTCCFCMRLLHQQPKEVVIGAPGT